MSSDPVSLKGIILTTSEFKDKDRMVRILSPDRGIVEFCAKGTGKPGSKYSFVSVPFMLCDFVLSGSHGYYYLKDASIIESNSEIMKDLDLMLVAGHIADCLLQSVQSEEMSPEIYELTVYALYSLSQRRSSPKTVYSAFNWRLLILLGLASSYERCTSCGRPLSDGKYKVKLGGGYAICEECISSGFKNTGYKIIGHEVIKALNYFAESPLSSIFAVRCGKGMEEELSSFTRAFLSVQFEKEYKDIFSQAFP